MAKSPAVLDHSYKFTSRKLTKEGEILSTTVGAALSFLSDMSPEEIICRYALREMALAKNAKRVATGAPASRIYSNTNLPPEVASMLATVKAAVAAAVPTMAPKAPSAPKAPPVAALDLSDPLEVAVSQELSPEPVKAAPKAVKAALAASAPRKARKLTPKAVKAAQVPEPTPAQVADPHGLKAPVMMPAPVAVPPVLRPVAGISGERMAVLRAKQAARVAAKV